MFCSKIGGECPHNVIPDNKYIFVMMPFEGFNSVYGTIKDAVEGVEGKEFRCERADEKYTNLSIWCNRICMNIRKAKYVIVDTTGRNPNVFYELGFAHARYNTKAIIITQNIKEVPFDIVEINHIIYSEKELPGLREELKNAIQALETEEIEEGYANKSTEEIITDLKLQLRAEEVRAGKFKNELVESEEREQKLKKSIAEIASIQSNPDAEARNKIAELEGTIAGLKEKLERTEKNKKDTIVELTKTLKEKEENLKILEESFDNYKGGKGVKSLLYLLLGDIRKRAGAQKWFNRAYGEGKKGNKETAIEYYTKALELNPEYPDAYYNRGATYYNLKDYEKAISDYNKALELNQEYVDAYNNRGLAYGDLKDYGKAISDFNKAIELNPEYADAYNNRGAAYYDLTEYEVAISDWNKAIELNPEDATAYYNRGFAYDYLKDYEKAISDWNKAIELNPEYADAYNNRGLAYRNLKDYETAISDWNKAIELNPEYAGAHENLSELYIITGNHKSALESITKVLSLSMDIKDRAVCLYLECIAKKMLQMDISDCENELNEILKREFETTWSFAEIESWVEDISNDQKAFIIEKTELIKEHRG
ncbi:Tetratricopeptide (TPR) repeat containing protein [Candidatus Methanophagaceae archaeon]|nr:Tetratricopeptide (TPR) repeat containing protein [Methanophagales archaeon]